MNYTSNHAENLQAALNCAARGWHVFPLKPGKKEPATEHGFQDAVTEPGKINSFFRGKPEFNLGIRTGPTSGFWMLGPDGQQGIDDLEVLALEHGEPLPRTYTVQSARGGMHYYFRWPEHGKPITNRTNHRGTKIDVRGEGGYVVAPPSTFEGKPYVVIEVCELAEAPAWLLAWVRDDGKTAPRIDPPPWRLSD